MGGSSKREGARVIWGVVVYALRCGAVTRRQARTAPGCALPLQVCLDDAGLEAGVLEG